MRVAHLEPSEVQANLDFSVWNLHRNDPDSSALNLMTRRGWGVLIALVFVIVICALIAPDPTGIAVLSVIAAGYLAIVVNRIVLFSKSGRTDTVLRVSDDDARSWPASALPVYTVLVPAYREPEVVAGLLRQLDLIDYPRSQLDIKLLLEADDEETIDAALACQPGDHIELVLIPAGQPRTKPKALDYALSLARGSLVTIFDAEDRPDPLQLRKAAIALSTAEPDVACVQAQLSFANAGQNLITKWFTIEYAMWFAFFLPGLVAMKAPLPLGGTSNHFRTSVLKELGGWDPFNVTEDADLGIRLSRHGYRCEVLDSTTLEEANSDFVNWVKQRSRWYKGYLQTAIVHTRRPGRLLREVGTGGTIQLTLFVVGTPVLALLNGVFWLMTVVWFLFKPHVIQGLFPAPLFYVCLSSWIIGNFLVGYLTLLTCRLVGRPDLSVAAFLVPLYWVMMTIAAGKALWQLVVRPTFWEKTMHGLDQVPARAGSNT